MPFFTLQMGPSGPMVTTFIGVSAARAAALKAQSLPIPHVVQIQALVDTGASGTCVDPSVLKGLGLTPTGSIAVCTPTTGTAAITLEQFDVGIFIPAADQPPFMRPNLPVTCTELLVAQGFHALIGRDVLSECLMVYDGRSKLFSLAY